MKKFTLLALMAIFTVMAFAQKPLNKAPLSAMPFKFQHELLQANGMTRTTKQVTRLASESLVTPPDGATPVTYYTIGGKFSIYTQNGWVDHTSDMSTIEVIINGTDIYMKGLAYYAKEAWIKGTIEGSTATFPNAQQIDEDEEYPEWILGSDDGGQTLNDIVFTIDPETGNLISQTAYIGESASNTAFQLYGYWTRPSFSLSEPAAPEVVVAPDGLETEEYAVTARNYKDDADVSIAVKIGFAGNDVYIQGLSTYLPEAWIKGTLNGTTITFAANQYLGSYKTTKSTYDMFLNSLLGANVVFDYDQETGTLTAQNEVFLIDGTVNGSGTYFDSYRTAVIKKVVEKAATPATPSITEISETNYGDVLVFDVPLTDVNGEGLLSSKLSFVFYKDILHEESPVTFTPEYFTKLTEEMTEIPFGFTENWDIYNGQIYLNMPHADWNRIGIKSIYRGGGEEHESEIFWYDMNPYPEATFDFNSMDVPVSLNGSNDGDITEDKVLVVEPITLTISPKSESASSPNRFWSTATGPQLRVYSGTLTFEADKFQTITNIEFNTTKWGAGNSADSGEFEGTEWIGNAQKVVVTIAANTQINSIIVTYAESEPTAVEVPEGLSTEPYNFTGNAKEYSEDDSKDFVPYESQIQVGFDGNDVYFIGLSADYPEGAAKGTLSADGKTVTIPANQFMGNRVFEFQNQTMLFPYYFTALDIQGTDTTMVDVVLNYDETAKTFTTNQTLALNGDKRVLFYYQLFNNVVISKINEVAATPATPSVTGFSGTGNFPSVQFSIPTTGTNGEVLLTNKLSYVVMYEKDNVQQPLTLTADLYTKQTEDMTTIPYTYDDAYDIYAGGSRVYLNQGITELVTWTKIGVKSIYTGGGESHESQIGWYDLVDYWAATGVKGISEDAAATSVNYYDLQGRRVDSNAKGLVLMQIRKADGTVKTVKTVRK